jgi:hypothetical protein
VGVWESGGVGEKALSTIDYSPDSIASTLKML